ncbi:hypothetical protein [uncultured Prevotella sp.]|uniref:hypothetical protein n=1 Tax=uncultured Prevotella sp. TaxID=159272 RepID=UPI002599C611|nr:hypothetical protein [uncultured Prevotella sp.]
MTLTEELQQAIRELNSLESRYIGSTPAQTATLQKLKSIDANYNSRKKVLETKIAYLKAQLDETSLNKLKSQIIYDDNLLDAMLD